MMMVMMMMMMMMMICVVSTDPAAVPRRLTDRNRSVDDNTGVNERQERSSRDKSEC